MSDEPIAIQRQKRPRVQVDSNAIKAVLDTSAFTENMSSSNAKKLNTSNNSFVIDLWGDKHYFSRAQHGDDHGDRDGIESSVASELIITSIHHLFFYSSCLEKFCFINHDCLKDEPKNRRIVCKQNIDGIDLNVVIEVHHFGHCRYEITIITAMKVNNFRIADGQYVIEMLDNETSILSKMEKGQLKEIYKN